MSRTYVKHIITFTLGLLLIGACTNVREVKLVSQEEILHAPPFAACHASTIAELQEGKLMAAFFGGSYESCNDVCIYTANYENGKWGAPKIAATGKIDTASQLPCWNPVLFKGSNNTLYLFYKIGINPREWWGMVKTSNDNGETWSEAKKLPDGFLGPVRNKPIELADGSIICPSSTESVDEKYWNVHMEVVNKELSKWQKVLIDTGNRFGVIQPTIIEHKNRDLQILCRSRQNCIVQSWSSDNGQTWDTLSCTNMQNPNSGIDAVTLSDGQFLLVYNPMNKGENWVDGRNILKVAISTDGLNWHDVYTLEDQPEGEYSYPAVIQTSDNNIHITYTANRTNIKHVILKLP